MRPALNVTLAVTALCSGLTAQDAEDPAWTYSSEVTVLSQYLWRGFVLNGSPSLQPSFTVGYRGLSVSSFANFSRRVPPGSRSFTEHDLEVDYSRETGAYTWSAGYANYYMASSAESPSCVSHEIYAGIARSGLLEPSFKLYRDLAEGDGFYWYGSIGHSFPVRERMTLQPTLGIGVNQHLYGPNTAVSNVDLGVSADFRVNSRLTACPTFVQMIGHRTLFGRHRAFGITLTFER
jgi:hypothetical protein